MSPSHIYTSDQSKPVLRGHGKEGYLPLQLTVAPEIKDALIELSTRNGTWVMDEIRKALENHILKSRSDGSPSSRVAAASDNEGV